MPTVLGQSFSRRELASRVGDFSQLFGVELFAYSDGRERSVRVLRFRTGSGKDCPYPSRPCQLSAGVAHWRCSARNP